MTSMTTTMTFLYPMSLDMQKKPPAITEFSKNMDKIMPNGEKKITEISNQDPFPPTTKSVKWYSPFKKSARIYEKNN